MPGFPRHMPGQVFADLAVAIADGADAVSGIGVLRDREGLFGPVASTPTAWRLLDRIGETHLPRPGREHEPRHPPAVTGSCGVPARPVRK